MRNDSTKTPKPESFLQRPRNADVRTREYLRVDEVKRLIKAAKSTGRHQARDGLIILMMFRHGLRVSELIDLQWSQVDWATSHIHINRVKRGSPSVQRIDGDEMRALRIVQREQEKNPSPWLFVSERRSPLTDHSIRKMVTRAGALAGFDFPIHPHMLRHSCGYYLASKGYDTRMIQDYLGHKQISHTVRYTQLAPGRFDAIKWD